MKDGRKNEKNENLHRWRSARASMCPNPPYTMVDFYRDYLRLCCAFLTLIGQWPYQKPIDYIPRRCVILIVIFSFAFVQIRTLYISNFDMDLLLKNSQVLGITVVGLTNLVTLYIKSDNCKEAFDLMFADWNEPKTEEQIKIQRNHLNTGYKISIYTAVILCCTTIATMFVPCIPLILDVLVPLNHTRPRALLYYLDLYIDDQEYFYVYYIFYNTSCVVGITAFAGNICMLTMVITHIFGMFESLGYKLMHAFDEVDDNRSTHQYVDNYQNVVTCIKMHCKTERSFSLIEKWLAPIILQHLVCGALVMGLSLAQVVDVNKVNYASIVNILFYMFFLVLSMSMGQKIIDLSTEIWHKLYKGEWYRSSVRSQKLLLVIMVCYTPHSLHAYKMMDVSLQTAETILRTSVSYCLLLRTL